MHHASPCHFYPFLNKNVLKTLSVSPLNPCDPHFIVRNCSTLGTPGHEAFHLSTNREHLVHPLVWGFLWVARRRKSWKFQQRNEGVWSPHQNGVAFGGLKWLVGLFVGMTGNKVFTINRVVALSIFMFLKSRIPPQKSWSVFMGCLVFLLGDFGKKMRIIIELHLLGMSSFREGFVVFFHVLKLFSTWIRGIRQYDGLHLKFIADSKKVNHLVFEKGTLCGRTSHFLAEKSTHDPAFAGYDPTI